MTSRARAFTLIEILSVLSIVLLMVGLLLPSLSKARLTARTSQCLCQQRTLGQFAIMYAAESKEHMPRSQHSAFAAGAIPWGYSFFPFITDRTFEQGDPTWSTIYNGAYRCPMDRRRDRWSYGYNVYYELARDETGGSVFNQTHLIPRPASSVLFTELSNITSADHAMAHYWAQFNAPHEIDASRHGRSSVAVFADAHAETRAINKLHDPATHTDAFNPATSR